MTGQVLAALIAAGTAIVLGGWNAWRLGQLERVKSELAREEAATRALLDYQYEARRRLYDRFEPALFQLLELADDALERIHELTREQLWVQILPGEDDPPPTARRPRLAKPNYAAVSTVYGLFAPLAVIRGMTRQLTLFDLTLEPRIELQYLLATRLYGSFKDDAKLAAIDPPIRYDPLHPEWRERRLREPATYWWQGTTMGRLEDILDLLTISSAGPNEGRLASFGEFERLWEDSMTSQDERRCKTLAIASNALLRFRPQDRPVFCRMLIAQARLYCALLRTRRPDLTIPTSDEEWLDLLALDAPARFEFQGTADTTQQLADLLAVTDVYLLEMLGRERAASQLNRAPH